MKVSELSDTELNRAMIWLYYRASFDCRDNGVEFGKVTYWPLSSGWHLEKINYLEDWNLLMPLYLGFKNRYCEINSKNLKTSVYINIGSKNYTAKHENPSRAVCEALVKIAMDKKHEKHNHKLAV